MRINPVNCGAIYRGPVNGSHFFLRFLPVHSAALCYNQSMLPVRKIFLRVLAVTVSVLLALVIADRLSILFLDPRRSAGERQFRPGDIRRPEPYVMFSGAPGGESWPLINKDGSRENIRLNSLGYRGEVPPMPKGKNEYRVIVLGGSTVFMGHPPVPRLLQYQFEKEGCREVKVYNFGVVSSVSGMELARLLFEAVDYAPDLIISYSGFNDIDEPFVADPRPGYPFNFMVYESNPVLESDIKSYPLFTLTAYGSNLARYFFPGYFQKKFVRIDDLREEAGYGTPPWRKEIARTYVQNMVKSQKVARAFGADFLAVFQPALYFKDRVSDEEKNLLAAGSEAERKNSLAIRDLVRTAAAAAQREQALNFVDLSDIFDEEARQVFKDRVHLIPQARPVVARRLYELIKEQVRARGICAEPGSE